MTIVRLGLAAAALAAGMMTGSAFAENVAMGALLADGWQVVDTEVVSKEIVVRAMGNADWTDDVLITLQKGAGLAFCHVSLLGTVSDANLLTYNCHTLPAAPSPPPPN